MSILDIILIGVGLSMDAVAVSVSNGIAESKMKWSKMLLIAGAFGLFQGAMPFLGYLLGTVFAQFITMVAPYLAFILLGFIGGKMIVESLKALRNPSSHIDEKPKAKLTLAVLLAQAVATSIDAFAVGIDMACYECAGNMALPVYIACIIIAVITFALSLIAVILGKKTGDVFSDKATLVGGIILVLIGTKMLIEGLITIL